MTFPPSPQYLSVGLSFPNILVQSKSNRLITRPQGFHQDPCFLRLSLPQLQLLQFRCVSASLWLILFLGGSWSSVCCKQLLKEHRNVLQTALNEEDTQPLQCHLKWAFSCRASSPIPLPCSCLQPAAPGAASRALGSGSGPRCSADGSHRCSDCSHGAGGKGHFSPQRPVTAEKRTQKASKEIDFVKAKSFSNWG